MVCAAPTSSGSWAPASQKHTQRTPGCATMRAPTSPVGHTMQSPLDISSLIAHRRPGYTLPAPFYLSPEVFERDVRLIFGRHWIYVGVEPEIPEPGDFFTVEIGKDSVIIVRDDDMGIRAFHNVCRHRG